MTFRISLLCSVALAVIPSVVQAADGSITITGTKNPDYVATDNVSGSSFDNFTATSNSASFTNDLIGTQNKNVVNQTINFSGSEAQKDIVGLKRDKGNINISRTNTINIKGGTIKGDILATEDSGNYRGSLRRTSNNINISGGKIGGNVEGGAGAESNVITITGGQFTPFSGGDDDDGGSCSNQTLGAIYAGVSNASTRNQSRNGTVILKDMNSENSFLKSFQEGTDNVSGTIFGSNLTGTSNMQFQNVKDTFFGGLRDFNNVSVDANSNLTLGGKSYYADNWNVAGTLDTNGKTIHAYKNSTINLDVANTGTLSKQFISDANVNAVNQGNINGIQTNKNISLNNSGKMTGNYNGATVNITNTGIINSQAGQTTTITSQNAGVLNNTGQIKEKLTVAGAMAINNNVGGNINAQIQNQQNVLNISNLGTINASSLQNQGNKTINLENKSGGVISNSLALTNGTLNLTNNSGGSLSGNALSTNGGAFNIANFGAMSGNTSLSASNDGSFSLINQATGAVSGNLTIASGLNQFENRGSFNNLNINNLQDGTILSNLGTISGTGSILSNNTFTLNNSGNISGAQTWKNVNLANAGSVSNLDLTADGGNVAIANDGVINGTNSIKSANGGTVDLMNNANGIISGNLTLNTTLAQFENNGLLQNLNLTSSQSNSLTNAATGQVQNVAFATDTQDFAINNSGIFLGNNQFSAQNGGSFSFVNNTDGKISGQFSVLSGLDSLNNQGTISDWTLSAETSNFEIDNTGEIFGTNILATNGTVTLNNSGKSSGDLVLNNTSLLVNHNSSTALSNNFIGQNGTENVKIDNADGSSVASSFAGNLGALTLKNNNSNQNAAQMSLTNNAYINDGINLDNSGYTQLTNNASIAGNITDNLTQAASGNKFDLTNNGALSGDISVMNNIFNFTNNASGVVTSNHIDAGDLYLNNAGTFQNTSDYTFSVQNHVDFNNSGTINGGDMVLKINGDAVNGEINNSGTMWSYGTTIGMGDNIATCANCDLKLYNTGTLMAVDPVNFVIPDLDSYAVNVPTMDVENQSGGVIGGSLNVNKYIQKSGSTWVTFMDKDKSQMSMITAQNDISIESGSILYIHTNNDVTQFTDGQTFQIVNAKGMDEDEVKTQLNNYTLKTDTPFATYEMINDGNNGYIVFNKVEAEQFADSTDMTTANHNNLASGSHRLFELFVNRNMKSTPLGLSSGDDGIKDTHVAFMPVAGHAQLDNTADNVGYKSNYYGGVGYIEHDFTPAFKTGLGLSYLNNSTDYNDLYQSTSTVDSYRPFAYLNYNDKQWRFDFVAGWGKHKIKNNRRYAFDDRVYVAQSDYESEEYSAHFSGGYRFYLEDDLIIQPMLGLFAANIKTDTYEETGNGPMNMHVESDDYNSLKTMVGIKAKKEYKLDNGMRLKPEMHVRWYHELGDRQGGVDAYFLAQQELFSSQGIEAPKDITDVAFRLTTENDEDLDIFVESFYQFGKGFYNVGGTVGLRYNF